MAKNATATITVIVKPTQAGTFTNDARSPRSRTTRCMSNNYAIGHHDGRCAARRRSPIPGATTGDYHDAATVSAKLTDTTTGAPIAGKSLTFTLNGAETCSGTTNAMRHRLVLDHARTRRPGPTRSASIRGRHEVRLAARRR